MSGIAHTKFTLDELKKLSAYALQHRIVPGEVSDKEQAKILNKQEQLWSRLLGVPIYHTWEIGDHYYTIPIRPIYEKEDDTLRKLRPDRDMDNGRPPKNTADNKVDPGAGKKKCGVVKKVVRKIKKK